MEKTETLSPTDQQLHELTRLLLEQRDACTEWSSHSIEREDEMEMRRLEKNARYGDLFGQMRRVGTEVKGLQGSGAGPAAGAGLLGLLCRRQRS